MNYATLNQKGLKMKFQIVIYNQAMRTPGYPPISVAPYLAMTGPFPGTKYPFRVEGITREEARTKLLSQIQQWIDTYPEIEVTEVDIQPSERAKQLDGR
jgi:hypothetical protein